MSKRSELQNAARPRSPGSAPLLMEGLRGYNLSDTLWAGENRFFSFATQKRASFMSNRYSAMRVPPKGTGKRASAALAAASALRAAARANNRAIAGGLRPSRGISSTSVFQNVSRRPELKFLDVLSSIAPAVAGTGSLTALNLCAQGTDAVQHIGRQTTMKSLYWLWQGNLASTTTGAGSLRLVIVYDKEAEGAAPTIAAGAQTDIFNEDSVVAQMNLNNRDRFVILLDEVVECIGTAGPQAFMRKGYRKVALPVVFNAVNTATITAINTGSVYAVVWGGGGFATTAPNTTLQTRIRFEDA